jgi:hypothetical protein
VLAESAQVPGGDQGDADGRRRVRRPAHRDGVGGRLGAHGEQRVRGGAGGGELPVASEYVDQPGQVREPQRERRVRTNPADLVQQRLMNEAGRVGKCERPGQHREAAHRAADQGASTPGA